MRRWEYCRLTWVSAVLPPEENAEELQAMGATIIQNEKGQRVMNLASLYLPGAEEQKVTASFDEVLNQLGQDGWELVSHTEGLPRTKSDLVADTLLFKREIEPPKQPIPPRPGSYSYQGP